MKRIQIVFLLLFFAGSLRAVTYPFSIIDTPGFYKLASNVTNQITISSSDVTLDMNGGTVSGGTNGIVINSGLNNVTIKDGMVTSVSSDGIQVGAGCTDITLKGIAISQAHIALNCEQVTNALIRDCDFNQSTTGLQLDTCQNIVLQNCTANANTHAGYDLISSTTCTVLECRAVSTGESNSDIDLTTVFGFVSANGNGNLFENCIANATMALSVTGSSSLIAGFALRGDESCTKIINSESSNTETNVNGFTVPYGILLETTLDQTRSVTGIDGSVGSVGWSPDGQFIGIAGSEGATGGSNEPLQAYVFDQVSGSVTSVAGALSGGFFSGMDWSPCGNYVAIVGFASGAGANTGLQVLSFDRTSLVFNLIGGGLDSGDDPADCAWSPDGRYIAVVGSFISGGTGDNFQVLSFDPATGRIVAIDGALGSDFIRDAQWSPCGEYIAVTGTGVTGGTGNEFQIYSFDAGAGTLTSVTGALAATDMGGVEWSPDGKYIAVGGFQVTGGTGDEFQIFRFDRSGGTLTSIAGALSGEVNDVHWSADGNYITVVGSSITGGTGDDFQIFQFDEAAGTIEAVTGALSGDIRVVAWAPDGSAIAMGAQSATGGTGTNFQIFSGLDFPSNNVIKGNTVYCNSGGQCPSGVGISAPSITNMVIGNTAFNNPIPRAANEPIVSSNYQFVTNVFDQLFGEGPALTQNICTSALTPQITVPDIPARIKRTELLLESLIDNLL